MILLSAPAAESLCVPFVWILPTIFVVALLMVAVPVTAPSASVVAAQPIFSVVAVVLRRLNEVEPVVIEVVNAGEVPNTATPVPVSSERSVESCADVVDERALRLFAESMSVPVVSGSV